MARFYPSKNPQEIVQFVAQHVKEMVVLLFWSVVAAGALTGTYVAARILIVVARTILTAVGV